MDVVDPEREREGDAADAALQLVHWSIQASYDPRPVALLSVEDVTLRFGGIVALDDVSLAADEGTITGLIGPNGAGKTTLFNVVTRLYKADAGRVVFDGTDLLRTPPYRIVRRGVARTFQNVVLFPTMTVTENVLVGAHTRMRPFGERTATLAGARDARLPRPHAFAEPARGRTALRHAEAHRARPRARLQAPTAAARRARRRPQPRGGRGAQRICSSACGRTSSSRSCSSSTTWRS